MFKKLPTVLFIFNISIISAQISNQNPAIEYRVDSSKSFLIFSINIGASSNKELIQDFYSWSAYEEVELTPVIHNVYNEFGNTYYFNLNGEYSLFFPNSFFGVSLGAQLYYDRTVSRFGGEFETQTRGQSWLGASIGPAFNLDLSEELVWQIKPQFLLPGLIGGEYFKIFGANYSLKNSILFMSDADTGISMNFDWFNYDYHEKGISLGVGIVRKF